MVKEISLTLHRFLVSGLQFGMGCVSIALIGLEVYQIFLRYFLSDGIVWGPDISTLLLFCIAWLGAPLLWLKKGHLAVDLFPSRPSGQIVMNILMLVAAIALIVVTRWAMDAFAMIELPALGIPASVKYFPMIIGTSLLVVAAALNLLTSKRP